MRRRFVLTRGDAVDRVAGAAQLAPVEREKGHKNDSVRLGVSEHVLVAAFQQTEMILNGVDLRNRAGSFDLLDRHVRKPDQLDFARRLGVAERADALFDLRIGGRFVKDSKDR